MKTCLLFPEFTKKTFCTIRQMKANRVKCDRKRFSVFRPISLGVGLFGTIANFHPRFRFRHHLQHFHQIPFGIFALVEQKKRRLTMVLPVPALPLSIFPLWKNRRSSLQTWRKPLPISCWIIVLLFHLCICSAAALVKQVTIETSGILPHLNSGY